MPDFGTDTSLVMPVDHDPFEGALPSGYQVPGAAASGIVGKALARGTYDNLVAPLVSLGKLGTGQSTSPGEDLGNAAGAIGLPGKALIAKGLAAVVGAAAPKALGEVAARPAAEAATAGIKAYHGSPHDFERFDLGKIGTGEGAQAYGHGLYFAENEDIARHYREGLAGAPSASFAGNADYPYAAAADALKKHQAENPLPSYLSSARKDIQNSIVRHMTLDAPGTESALAKYIDEIKGTYPADAQEQVGKWANEAASVLRPHIAVSRPGRMYQVSIKAHPDEFLDWDKPLSEQHPKIKEALGLHKLPQKPTPEEGQAVFALARERGVPAHTLPEYQELQRRLDSANKDAWQAFGIPGSNVHTRPEDLTGGQLMQGLEQKMIGPDVYGGKSPGASDHLRQAGIPGIKYLDQGSRATSADAGAKHLSTFQEADGSWKSKIEMRGPPTGNSLAPEHFITTSMPFKSKTEADAWAKSKTETPGTRNYVVFDDKLIDILKKYGIAGIGALPAMGAYHYQTQAVDHDPFAGRQFASGGRVLSHYVDPDPSEAQKAAGNYRKAHISIHGMDIAIENPRGTFRHGVGKDGREWKVRMPAHYGYIKGTVGRDKDHVDCYVGPHVGCRRTWVIDQNNSETGRFDEHKVFIGFASEAQVRRVYKAAFSDGKGAQRLGAIKEMDVGSLKDWLKGGETMKPIGKAA